MAGNKTGKRQTLIRIGALVIAGVMALSVILLTVLK